MKFRDLVSSKHMYAILRSIMTCIWMSRAHFSHSTLTTEMASSLVPVNFRTLYDLNLNEAINVYDSIYVYDFSTEMFYCRRKSF